MATVRHVISSSGLRKFQVAWFLFNRGYVHWLSCTEFSIRTFSLYLKKAQLAYKKHAFSCMSVSCWCNRRRVLNAFIHTAFSTSIKTFRVYVWRPNNLESKCNNVNVMERKAKIRAYYSVTKKTLWIIHSVSVLWYFEPSCLKDTLSCNPGSIQIYLS